MGSGNLETQVQHHHQAFDEDLREALHDAQTTLQEMDQRMAELARANEALRRQLDQEQRLRLYAEQRLARMMGGTGHAAPDPVLREQLSNAVEELKVMAEELSLAQNALADLDTAASD